MSNKSESPNPQTSPRKIAMDLLAYREHSRLELRNKLLLRDLEPSAIEATLDSLESDKLLDDARFAHAYVRMRANRGFGPVRIRQELHERGVNGEYIHGAITDNDLNWQQLACEQRQKKFGKNIPTDFAARAKQMRFLQYRGFNNEQITFAMGKNNAT